LDRPVKHNLCSRNWINFVVPHHHSCLQLREKICVCVVYCTLLRPSLFILSGLVPLLNHQSFNDNEVVNLIFVVARKQNTAPLCSTSQVHSKFTSNSSAEPIIRRVPRQIPGSSFDLLSTPILTDQPWLSNSSAELIIRRVPRQIPGSSFDLLSTPTLTDQPWLKLLWYDCCFLIALLHCSTVSQAYYICCRCQG
jgi:hypothetical protein